MSVTSGIQQVDQSGSISGPGVFLVTHGTSAQVYDFQSAQPQRLVVLIPNHEFDIVEVSRVIRTLALQQSVNVYIISLVNNADQEMTARRRLATMAALVRDAWLTVNTHLEWGKSWVKIAKKEIHGGDILICPSELSVPAGLNNRQPLVDVLVGIFDIPVYRLQGFFRDLEYSKPSALKAAAFWLGALLILASFFKVETVVDLVPVGWPADFIAILIVLLEILMIWLWISILG